MESPWHGLLQNSSCDLLATTYSRFFDSCTSPPPASNKSLFFYNRRPSPALVNVCWAWFNDWPSKMPTPSFSNLLPSNRLLQMPAGCIWVQAKPASSTQWRTMTWPPHLSPTSLPMRIGDHVNDDTLHHSLPLSSSTPMSHLGPWCPKGGRQRQRN